MIGGNICELIVFSDFNHFSFPLDFKTVQELILRIIMFLFPTGFRQIQSSRSFPSRIIHMLLSTEAS